MPPLRGWCVLARRFARALRAGERRRDGLLRKSRRRRGTISGRRGRSDGGRPGLLTSKRDPSSRKTLLWMTAKNRWMLGRWARRSGSSADPSARKTLPLDDGQMRVAGMVDRAEWIRVCSQGVESLRQLPPFIPFQTVVELQHGIPFCRAQHRIRARINLPEGGFRGLGIRGRWAWRLLVPPAKFRQKLMLRRGGCGGRGVPGRRARR